MAVKATNQTTLIDLTDAYAVHLTCDNVTWLGDTDSVSETQSITTQVMALRGAEQIPCRVGTMSLPNGVAAVSDGKSPSPTITVTANASVTTPGSFTIPVIVEGDITINKTFSYAIAYKGNDGSDGSPGADGRPGVDGKPGEDGADAITLVIESSAGTIFKNTSIATTLTAHVYKGGQEITGSSLAVLGTIKWYKDSSASPVSTGSTLTISAGDVSNKSVYTARLES